MSWVALILLYGTQVVCTIEIPVDRAIELTPARNLPDGNFLMPTALINCKIIVLGNL